MRPCCGCTLHQCARTPGHQQPEHVAQIVPGVGQERHRVGQDAEGRFEEDDAEVQRRAEGKRNPEILGRVRVPRMAVSVAAIVVCVIVGTVAVGRSMILFMIGHTIGSCRHEMLGYGAAIRAFLSQARG